MTWCVCIKFKKLLISFIKFYERLLHDFRRKRDIDKTGPSNFYIFYTSVLKGLCKFLGDNAWIFANNFRKNEGCITRNITKLGFYRIGCQIYHNLWRCFVRQLVIV